MSDDKLIKKMRVKAEAVQAVVYEMDSFNDAFRYACKITQQQGGRHVAAAGFFPREALESLRSICTDAGLSLLVPPFRPHSAEIDTAITPAEWGVAETGTLVLNSSSEDIRLATMLADTHVALLPVSRIKPDIAAIENELDQILKTESATYLAFITGASRTADIERVLAIGVHGPRELHILMIERVG